MRLEIAVCDDEYGQIRILEECINNTPVWLGKEKNIRKFKNASELLSEIRGGSVFSYIFLDIEMPGISGLEAYQELAETGSSVIFVSTHAELLPDVFLLRPPGFLMKPYNLETFTRTVESVSAMGAETKFFAYTVHGTKRIIPCADIYCFTTEDHYLYIHTTDGREILLRGTLKEAERQLSEYGFFLVNQSCLANLKYCEIIDKDIISVMQYTGYGAQTDNVRIKVARRKLKDFNDAYLRYRMSEKQW